MRYTLILNTLSFIPDKMSFLAHFKHSPRREGRKAHGEEMDFPFAGGMVHIRRTGTRTYSCIDSYYFKNDLYTLRYTLILNTVSFIPGKMSFLAHFKNSPRRGQREEMEFLMPVAWSTQEAQVHITALKGAITSYVRV